jgi:hypothetical protein
VIVLSGRGSLTAVQGPSGAPQGHDLARYSGYGDGMTHDEGHTHNYVPTEQTFSHTADAYPAVGRVAIESALLDEFLNELLDKMVGSDKTWILFEGQSTSWLIEACLLVLNESDPYSNKYASDQHAKFKQYAERANMLRAHRNTVVHGIWRSGSVTEDQLRPRPWGKSVPDGEPVYCIVRSRLKKPFVEQLWTIGDVERLADEIHATYTGWAQLYREMESGRGVERRLFPRW